MKKLILPLVLGTMIFTSCEQKAEKAAAFDIEAVKKDIEDWQVNFEAIVKNKDSVGFANLFAENGVRMAPNSVSVEGRANILKSVVDPFKIIGTTNLTLGDAMGDENTITTYGTYEHFTPDGASLDKGKSEFQISLTGTNLPSIRLKMEMYLPLSICVPSVAFNT